jgi:hypothetical protein
LGLLILPDHGLRARVERLLRGDFRSDDLTRLFLYARGQCDGRESIQEIGDFVAHHSERTKGIVTLTVRDWFATVRFKGGRAIGETIDGHKLPSIFPAFLWASQRRLSHQTIKKNTGLSKAEADKLVPIVINKLIRLHDGNFYVTPGHTKKEIELINCLVNYIVAKPAFNSDRLYDDFAATLKSHGLLHKNELNNFEHLRAAIALYAVTIMHRCRVVIDDAVTTDLIAMGHSGGNIGVYSLIPADTPLASVRMGTAIFATNLTTASHCEPDLLAIPPPWDFELEVSQNMRLARLV